MDLERMYLHQGSVHVLDSEGECQAVDIQMMRSPLDYVSYFSGRKKDDFNGRLKEHLPFTKEWPKSDGYINN